MAEIYSTSLVAPLNHYKYVITVVKFYAVCEKECCIEYDSILKFEKNNVEDLRNQMAVKVIQFATRL